jgi:hypothetical protein
VYEQTIVTQVPASVDEAFTWLTDYRTGLLRDVLRGPKRRRTVEHIGPNRLHVTTQTNWPEVVEDGIVMLSPPARWSYSGKTFYLGKEVGKIDRQLMVEPQPGGCRLTVSLQIDPTSLWLRLYLFLRWSSVQRANERHYEFLAGEIAKELGR